MNISEMHQYFRQCAQQMGMQNVRAILPEQIDILINTSISDTVNQIIKENIGITSDRVITDNSKLGSVNALRSLYKIHETNISKMFTQGDNAGHLVHLISDEIDGITESGLYDEDDEYNIVPKYLFLIDFAINYKRDTFITSYFPVRIIDDVYLADVLNDFILSPRFRSPIILITDNEFVNKAQRFDLYIDKGTLVASGDSPSKSKLENGLIPNALRISYLARPSKVAYNEDNEGLSVDCNLPEYMHVDVIKRAVDLYHTALQGSLYAAQQAQQVQQRENIRNNAQPSN